MCLGTLKAFAIATVLRNHDCETRIVGGVEGHMHALFALSRNYSIADIVKEIKRTSSKRPEEHHKRVTFQDEFRAFLRKYNVEFDERYAWD
jgi:putative transposase